MTRFFLLVGLLASVVVFLGIYFAMRGRMPLHRLVFVLVLCFGMLYSFVLPPYAAPDEKYHINQSFTLACKWANVLSPDEWRMGNVPLDMTYRREHDFDPLLQNEKTTVFSWQELSQNCSPPPLTALTATLRWKNCRPTAIPRCICSARQRCSWHMFFTLALFRR